MSILELKIDEEFHGLIPVLTPDEYKQLEDNLLAEGCRDALVIWDGVIVDGHNRYEICTKHNIEFRTAEKQFKDRDEAKEWIIRNQFGRRNLPPFERSKLALQLEELIKIKAKANQEATRLVGRGVQQQDMVPQKSAKPLIPIETRKEIAKAAGVSHDTIDKVRVIEKEATPEQKARLSTGQAKVNTVYNELRPKKPREPKTAEKVTVPEEQIQEAPPRIPVQDRAWGVLTIDDVRSTIQRFMSVVCHWRDMENEIAVFALEDIEAGIRDIDMIIEWTDEMREIFCDAKQKKE